MENSALIKKKICMLGAFAVGKTSLVQQFAYGLFSEKYHTTVGVRIEKKQVKVDDIELNFLIWDLHGEDDFQEVRASYLRGAAGCVYVVDGTRRETVKTVMDLHARMDSHYPNLPGVLLLNKRDQQTNWELTGADRQQLAMLGCPVMEVSAKTADSVDEGFRALGQQILSVS